MLYQQQFNLLGSFVAVKGLVELINCFCHALSPTKSKLVNVIIE